MYCTCLPFISYGSENIFIIDLYYKVYVIENETSKESSQVTTILTSNKIVIQNRYIHVYKTYSGHLNVPFCYY